MISDYHPPCSVCGEPLKVIKKHPESKGYGYCERCKCWQLPKKGY